MQESACRDERGEAKLRTANLSFAEIPSQSRLFLEYQANPISLSQFFPSAIASIEEVGNRVPTVLENYPKHRDEICDILTDQNRGFEAADKVIQNIDMLRGERTVAVLTGQQAGVFGGPLYTIHKAITTIKMAEDLRSRGLDAVPIFWAATEDHDFAEIAEAFDIDTSGSLLHSTVKAADDAAEKPVGDISVSESIWSLIDEHINSLPRTEFTENLRSRLMKCWSPDLTYGQAFSRFISSLFSEYGLIVVDPLDVRLKRLSTPLIANAIEKTNEIVSSLIARSKELEDAGYHAQVLVADDHVPFFLIDEDGRRKALKRSRDGKFYVHGARQEFSESELVALAENRPESISPAVMLRPVVQDFLFPTICYFGGGAEIAYFAQNSEVYRILKRPVTPILHRQSFTFIEPKHSRTLEKFDLKFTDLFAGFDALLPSIIDRFVNPLSARLFADVEENINAELHKLDAELSKIDPTLAGNLATRRRKILYHIAALQKKFHRVQGKRDETVNRQLKSAFTELMPRGGLQERTIGVTTYLNRHGHYFIDWLYESIDLDDRGHRIIYS
jgi:bacillithiol biosynthesis cysteine-adding enzyme BshC